MSISLHQFQRPATSGKTICFDEFAGRYWVLYFYPKDSTPGCTQESRDFAAYYGVFQQHGVEIIGVSRDSIKSHENFKSKQALPFELISDADEMLCEHFDVIKLKNMYGKQVRGIERSTFLIGPEGQIVAEWRKLSVKGHVEAVLSRVREILGQ